MTSRASSSESFVYITLPGQTKAVTAGRFVLTQDRSGVTLGRFVYGNKYMSRDDRIEIDPFQLKLSEETYETTRFGGLFSALRDSGPDFWGRRVIEKHSGKTQLSELDYLLESPDDRAGALGFGLNQTPPAPKRKFNQTIQLPKLQELADALIRDDITDRGDSATQVQDLMLLGTSMGGARPKAVVEDDGKLWVAKFSRPDDRWNNPRVEHAMLELARKCGINAAQSRIETVAGEDVLLVQRFDRERTENGYSRARMISGLTMLRIDDSLQDRARWSYVVMAEELRRVVSEPKKDAAELFRRMCFNGLISNLDDHPRNHALMAMDRNWRLSPAYDLTPSPVVSQDRRDLAMACGDDGRFANAKNILSQHTRFLLEKDEAQQIVNSTARDVADNWYGVVRSHGVTERDAESIKSAFVYPGFNL